MQSRTRRSLRPSPAGVLAMLALLLALTSGAYAASKYVITSTKQIKPSVLKALKGKNGAPGAPGVNGANGKDGAPGTPGAAGAPGAPGTSVTSSPVGAGGDEGNCVGVGGSKFVAGASKTYACNGEEGEEGSPWTAGGLLPSGKTETGTWAVGYGGTAAPLQFAPISFTLPLATSPELIFVSLMNQFGEEFAEDPGEEELKGVYEEADAKGCPGIDNGVPLADPGKLCVYASTMINTMSTGSGFAPTKPRFEPVPQVFAGGGEIPKADGSGTEQSTSASPVGTSLKLNCSAASCNARGVWAVTAE